MKMYIQFYTHNLRGELVESLGSDSILPIDGRLSVHNAAQEAYTAAYNKRRVMQQYGFVVRRGDLKNYRSLTELIVLPDYTGMGL